MLNLRDFHELGWQTLSMLQLCLENKTKRNADKAPTDDDAEHKANVRSLYKIKVILKLDCK